MANLGQGHIPSSTWLNWHGHIPLWGTGTSGGPQPIGQGHRELFSGTQLAGGQDSSLSPGPSLQPVGASSSCHNPPLGRLDMAKGDSEPTEAPVAAAEGSPYFSNDLWAPLVLRSAVHKSPMWDKLLPAPPPA